ncbi:hypothetical protein V6N12_057428 [Hibiscus sabdariffa]|uniref:TPX2 C-terminal domain-containing protein n=1 Tax=Hibiscus sabdariffa TaxID=183260 RepID=A0ABR2C6Y1_9ROSI
MGRELSNVHMDDSPNGVMKSNGLVNSNGDPRVLEGIESKNYEVKQCTEENSILQNGMVNQDVLDVKSANFGTYIPDEKDEKTGDRKFTDNEKLSPASKSSGAEHIIVHDTPKAGANGRASVNSTPSPTVTKTSERGSPLTTPMSRKLFKPFDRRHPDEEDNWSVASTTAASFRTSRSRVTIGTAPTFKSVERAQRRKEFYQKLEEKHQALEAERSQYEARTKEEQEAALKQLRKGMVVKANPVPSFYYKGPPPKVEPKKLPLTRPKSPNLSRRKSCSDAVHSSLDEKAKTCCRTHRHSLGTHMERSTTANEVKSKGQVRGQSSFGTSKAKDRAKPTTTKAAPKITKQSNPNITVES